MAGRPKQNGPPEADGVNYMCMRFFSQAGRSRQPQKIFETVFKIKFHHLENHQVLKMSTPTRVQIPNFHVSMVILATRRGFWQY